MPHTAVHVLETISYATSVGIFCPLSPPSLANDAYPLVVAVAIADIEDDLTLQLTASGFEVTQVDDEAAAAAQAEAEDKARRAAARKAAVRSHLHNYHTTALLPVFLALCL